MARREFTQWAALVAYLVAVAVACLIVGAMIGVNEVIRRQQPFTAILLYTFLAPIFGFLPGLLVSLPGVIFSAWIRRRFSQFSVVWCWFLGMGNGIVISLPIAIISTPNNTSLVAAFAIAGGCSGVVFAKVEELLD